MMDISNFTFNISNFHFNYHYYINFICYVHIHNFIKDIFLLNSFHISFDLVLINYYFIFILYLNLIILINYQCQFNLFTKIIINLKN